MAVAEKTKARVSQERLVEAAADIANREGLEELSMTALASALGVRTPSLYSHVEGIEDVKRLLALYGLEKFDRWLARSALGKASEDAARAIFRGYLDFVRNNPGVYAAMVPTPPKGDRVWNEAKDRVTLTTLAALQGYGLSGDAEIHALRGLRSLAHGFASLEMSGALKNPVDREESYEWLVSIFLEGLKQKAREARPAKGGRK